MSVQRCEKHDQVFESHASCDYCVFESALEPPKTITIPIAEHEAMRLDTERWKGLVNLWLLSTELSLTQNEEGGYSIIQTEPVENEIFAPLEGDTPEQAISAAIKEGN